MSNAELEHAAMGPRRWIEFCASFEKKYPNEPGAKLLPKTTRTVDDSLTDPYHPELFIVPGGRYMVSWSPKGIFVWDLGYTSSSDCKLVASVRRDSWEGASYCNCMIQATPDGMGLVIFAFRPSEYRSVYEIYPQSETPQLTHITRLDFYPTKDIAVCLLPDGVLWYDFYPDRIVFRVWDYRANHSISFSADVDLNKLEYDLKVIATHTAIIVLCVEEILVWAIPPLSPQLPDFLDHNPTHMPPLFRIPFPDGILPHTELLEWKMTSHWYFSSSQPLYFDISCRDESKLHRFEIIVKPDLSDTTLHFINTETVPHDFYDVGFQPYSLCEDTLVAYWDSDELKQCGIYTGLTSSRSTTLISPGGPAAKMLLSPTAIPTLSGYTLFLCPASGRCVYLQYIEGGICRIVVDDLF